MKLLVAVLALVACGCRSKLASKGDQPSDATGAPSGYVHFEDTHFAFDYPPEFKVTATTVQGVELLSLDLKSPPRGSTDGGGTIQPDPMHPDMLLDDEVDSFAKTAVAQGNRIFGGVRSLPSKNGTCKGLVEVGLWKPCPANAPFKPAGRDCYDATLNAFCLAPSGKRLVYAAELGPLPTADQLTPEAANYGRIHERILSTIEFK